MLDTARVSPPATPQRTYVQTNTHLHLSFHTFHGNKHGFTITTAYKNKSEKEEEEEEEEEEKEKEEEEELVEEEEEAKDTKARVAPKHFILCRSREVGID